MERDPARRLMWGPVYPIFLGTVYRVVGSGGFELPEAKGDEYAVATRNARIAQQSLAAIATSLSIALLPFLAWQTNLGVRCGLLAGCFMALFPLNLWVETSGGGEQSYAVIALEVMLLCFTSLHKRNWNSMALAGKTGFTLGLAALLNPVLVPAGGLMLAAEGYRQRRRLRTIMPHISLLMIIAGLVVVPWTYRNYRVFGVFIPIRGSLGLELAIGNNDSATGKSFGTYWDDPASPYLKMHPSVSASERARLMSMGEVEYMKSRMAEATSWIERNPARFLELTVRRALLFWCPPPDLWSPSVSARRLRSVLLTGMSVIAFLGLGFLWRRHRSFAALHFAALFGPCMPYLIVHVEPRYRYIIMWNTALLCAYAAWSIAHYVKRNPAPTR